MDKLSALVSVAEKTTEFENSPEYWMKTSELVRLQPHVAGFATEMWRTLEPTQENYRWFSKYIKTVAFQQAQFLSTLRDRQPDSPLLQGLQQKYGIDFELVDRERKTTLAKEENLEFIEIEKRVPVKSTERSTINSDEDFLMFNWDMNVGDLMAKFHDKTVDAVDFLQNHKMAMLISALIAIGGLGADWISSSYWSVGNLIEQIKDPAVSLAEVKGLLIGTGLTLGEIFAATMIFKQGPKLIKDGKYWQGALAEAVGITTALATIPSYFLTMNFLRDLFVGDPNDPVNMITITKELLGEKLGKLSIDYMWHFTTFFVNYYSDLFIVLAQHVFERGKSKEEK